jgi:hypothetical protein
MNKIRLKHREILRPNHPLLREDSKTPISSLHWLRLCKILGFLSVTGSEMRSEEATFF